MALASLAAGVQPPAVRRLMIASLAVVMTAATGSTVLAAGWTAASWVAVAIGVAGALEAVALTLLRPGRLLSLVAPPALLLLTLLIPYAGTVPVAPQSGLPTVLGRFATAAVTGLAGNLSWDFNVGLGTLLWACGVWAVEMALSGRRGALATAPCWAVLAVNVINSPSPDQAASAAVVAAVTAILLIAAVQLEWLTSGWGQRGVPVLPGTDSRFAAAGAMGGALVLLLALAVPPLTSSDISGRLFSFGRGAGGGGHGSGGPAHGSGVGAPGTVRFDPATVPGGALTLAGVPVLSYHTSSSTGAYLRMATDPVFDGGNWVPATDNSTVVTETNPPGQINRDRVVAEGGVGASVQRVSANLVLADDTSGNNLLPFPGEPDSASVTTQVNGLHLPGSLHGLLTVDAVAATELIVGRSLTTGGTQSLATADQLRAAGPAYPGFIDRGGYRQLPDDGTGGAQVVAALAEQWTRNAPTAYDKASAIEATLRNPRLFHYTLNPPLANPVQQVWPVTYFLTTSHSGYCQYFAAAMGAMLRALHIPARLVNGYGPGTPPDSAARSNPNASWHVSSNDAHTWVEAYFPGFGWVPFEPTPPSSAGDYQTFTRGPDQAPPATTGAPPTAPPSRPPAPRTPTPATTSLGSAAGATLGPPPALTTSLSVTAGLALVLALVATWFLRPRGIRGIWRRVGLVGRLVGVPRDRALTLREYVERVAAALPSDTVRLGHVRGQGPVGPRPLRRRVVTALSEIAAISDVQLFANQPPSARELMRMRRAWRRVARVVPALGWRSLLRRSMAP